MPSLVRRHPTSNPFVVVATILALLLAQGLRVCVHQAEVDASKVPSGIAHLETDLTADDSEGTFSSDRHVPFSVAFKKYEPKFESLAIPVTLLALPLLQGVGLKPVSANQDSPLPRHPALRPPLRAPPR